MIWGVILVVIAVTMAILTFIVTIVNGSEQTWMCFYSFLSGILLVAGLWVIDVEQSNNPKAIDVYKGKTTLEITYRDSVAVDSVVIFKE